MEIAKKKSVSLKGFGNENRLSASLRLLILLSYIYVNLGAHTSHGIMNVTGTNLKLVSINLCSLEVTGTNRSPFRLLPEQKRYV